MFRVYGGQTHAVTCSYSIVLKIMTSALVVAFAPVVLVVAVVVVFVAMVVVAGASLFAGPKI